KAYIDGDADGIEAGSVNRTAQDNSDIFAFAGAASVAAAVGAVGVSGSVGIAVARNQITSHVESFISNADQYVKSNIGDITLTAHADGRITVYSAAASLAVGGGPFGGMGVSGGGAIADNVILTKSNAYVTNSVIDSANDVLLDSQNSSLIDAVVAAASGSVGIGAGGNAVSIGAVLARNYIGWEPDYHYTTSSGEKHINPGDRVKLEDDYKTYYVQDINDSDNDGDTGEIIAVANNALGEAGGVYQYKGDAATLDLSVQNYANSSLWELVSEISDASPAEVKAYVENSSVKASGELKQTASAEETVDAIVAAGSAALAGGLGAYTATAAGALAFNKIST
ncbi:MAG: hypothetical protein ACP5I1_21480, partial [Candidatus Hinthialibacter sp.]